jgi:membrane protein
MVVGSVSAHRTSGERSVSLRGAVSPVVEGFAAHDLLTSASAIAFRILFAIVPVLLFALALAGVLQLGDVWGVVMAPRIQPVVTPAVFAVLNETIVPVLATQQWFWLTLGGVLALWEVSGAVRGVMGALNRVYESERERPFARRMLVSLALSLAVGSCLALAGVVVGYGPLEVAGFSEGALLGALDFVVRWGLAIALLLGANALLVRYAPTSPQPLSWVSIGSLLTVAFWVAISLLFGWYVTAIAPYATIFGSLAGVIVLMTYLYLSSIAFLAGVQLDAVIREQVEGTAHPEE